MTDFTKRTNDAMAKLAMIEEAVAKSAGRFDGLREKADEVYAARVEQLAEMHGVDINKAHGLATNDDLAKRAYALSNDLAEQQQEAHEGGSQIAAYVG